MSRSRAEGDRAKVKHPVNVEAVLRDNPEFDYEEFQRLLKAVRQFRGGTGRRKGYNLLLPYTRQVGPRVKSPLPTWPRVYTHQPR